MLLVHRCLLPVDCTRSTILLKMMMLLQWLLLLLRRLLRML